MQSPAQSPAPILLDCPPLRWESSTLETQDEHGRPVRLEHHESVLDDRPWTWEEGERKPSRRRVSLYHTVTASRMGVRVNVPCRCRRAGCFAWTSHYLGSFDGLEAFIATAQAAEPARWHAGLEWHCRIAWEQHLQLKSAELSGLRPAARTTVGLEAVVH